MTHQGMRRRNKNYGDSPVRRSGVPITSSVLESCSLLPTLAASRRFASATRGTASRLPFGSTVESWPPQPSACPATQPPLCRALLMQPAITASVGIARAASRKTGSLSPRRTREETRSVRRRRLLARSAGRGQPTRPAIPDGSADSWVAGSASLRPHLKHADRAPG